MKKLFLAILLTPMACLSWAQTTTVKATKVIAESSLQVGSSTSQKVDGFNLVIPASPTDTKLPTSKAVKDFLLATAIIQGGAASGDLSGTYPGPSVVALRGRPLSATAPTLNQVLKWSGSQWVPGDDQYGPTYSAGAGIDVTGTVISNTGDLSATNELQTLSLVGNDLTLSNGGGTITLPAQGITNLNGLTAQTQTFSTGTTGTDINWLSSGSVHTLNVPTASASARGLLSAADWSAFNGKIGGSGSAGQIAYLSGSSTISGSNNLFWDIAASRLCVGSNTPGRKADFWDSSNPQLRLTSSSGNYTDLQTSSSGNLILSPSGSSVLIGVSSPTTGAAFEIGKTFTNAIGGAVGVETNIVFSASSATSGGFYGHQLRSRLTGSQQYSNMKNFLARTTITNTGGSNVSGYYSLIETSGTANGGAYTSGEYDLSHAATGTITTYNGIKISISSNAGTLTNTNGIYIGDITTGTQTNKAYSIYATDPNAQSRFDGQTGFGINPGARVHIHGEGNTNVTFGLIVTPNGVSTASATIVARDDGKVIVGKNTANSSALFEVAGQGVFGANANTGGYDGALYVNANGSGRVAILGPLEIFSGVSAGWVGQGFGAQGANRTFRISAGAGTNASDTENLLFSYGSMTRTTSGTFNGAVITGSINNSGITTHRALVVKPVTQTLATGISNITGIYYDPAFSAAPTTNYAAVFRSGQVIVNGDTPDPSAQLEIAGTTGGFLPTRLTAAQRNAISSPATGLTLYCTDCTANDASTGVMQTYNGTTWKNHW